MAALILSLVLAGSNAVVTACMPINNAMTNVAVSVVLTFLVLCAAHLCFGTRYVSWQPDVVHRQYNLLWAGGV